MWCEAIGMHTAVAGVIVFCCGYALLSVRREEQGDLRLPRRLLAAGLAMAFIGWAIYTVSPA
jgi:hypothetical protein